MAVDRRGMPGALQLRAGGTSIGRRKRQPERESRRSMADVLVSFALESKITLFDLSHMEEELAMILGRRADVVLK